MESKGAQYACPISHKPCKFCTLYRGRHYYALPCCKEYLRRLHEASAPQKKAKAAGYPQYFEKVNSSGSDPTSVYETEQGGKTSRLPKLKVSRPWYPFEETCDIESAAYLPFSDMGTIIVVEERVIRSYEELVQLATQERYRAKQFIQMLIVPAVIGGG